MIEIRKSRQTNTRDHQKAANKASNPPLMIKCKCARAFFLDKSHPLERAFADRCFPLHLRSGELQKLQAEAEAALTAARKAAQAMITEAKEATQKEQNAKLAEAKAVRIPP